MIEDPDVKKKGLPFEQYWCSNVGVFPDSGWTNRLLICFLDSTLALEGTVIPLKRQILAKSRPQLLPAQLGNQQIPLRAATLCLAI